MRVIKVGGGCLNGTQTIKDIVDLIVHRGQGHVFVVSALHGITDLLLDSLETALADETHIPAIMGKLKARHLLVARHLIRRKQDLKEYAKGLEQSLGKLERLYYGLNFTRAITPRLTDVITSYGERLSARLMAAILCSRGISAACRMPHKIGLITDGKYGDATADLTKTARHFKTHLTPLLGVKKILFLPGFFGASKDGKITTFGRGGSDYAAAVVAVALIGIVGDGIRHLAGIAARCFTAVADCRVNVEIISFGPSRAALYFIVKKRALASGINAIHSTFFSTPRCRRGA